jgi:hypothetical protein
MTKQNTFRYFNNRGIYEILTTIIYCKEHNLPPVQCCYFDENASLVFLIDFFSI